MFVKLFKLNLNSNALLLPSEQFYFLKCSISYEYLLCSTGDKGIHSCIKSIIGMFGVFTYLYTVSNWELLWIAFVSPLECFPEIPVCWSKQGMVWHKMDNSTQGHRDFLWAFGHEINCAVLNIKLPSFHFLQDRKQCLSLFKSFSGEKSLGCVAIYFFISANSSWNG